MAADVKTARVAENKHDVDVGRAKKIKKHLQPARINGCTVLIAPIDHIMYQIYKWN